ncbi:MAG: helix-turn-helix transcriptional regulator, partial [Carboxylicivirga sp.]|nr:helix-turn-helix transcriptional regulator [Carboxylicivirga sp.]
ANKLNISYSLFRTEFKKYTGVSPGQYLLQLKIQMAKNLLSNSQLSVKEVSFKSGFESPYYFSRVFKKHTGHTPTEFKSQMGLDQN